MSYIVSYHESCSIACNSECHFRASIVPVAISVILGYLIFFLSSSSCDHSNSFIKFANFGVASVSRMAAFNWLATWNKKNSHIVCLILILSHEILHLKNYLTYCVHTRMKARLSSFNSSIFTEHINLFYNSQKHLCHNRKFKWDFRENMLHCTTKVRIPPDQDDILSSIPKLWE